MHKVLSIAIGLTLLVQSFSTIGLLTGFYINQEYIAEAFCINQDKPEMRCNGKCYLKTQLEQEEEKKSDQPERRPELKDFIIYFDSEVQQDMILQGRYCQSKPYSFSKGNTPAFDIFHPPKAS